MSRGLLELLPSRARPFDVVGFGLNSVDLITVVPRYPERGTKQPIRAFERRPGGQAATAMVTCARLGWRASYIGAFGDDEHGRLSRESLIEEGVDVSGCRVAANTRNQFAVIVVDEEAAERTVMWHRDPGLTLAPGDVDAAAVAAGRVLLVDCHQTPAATRAGRAARRAGARTVVDVEKVRPGIAELLREMDVIIAAEGFPSAFTGHADPGRAIRAIEREFRPALTTVTLGAEGALSVAEGREIRTPAFRVTAADTTGAGDVFRGGFVAAWLDAGSEADVEDLLRRAAATAALKCRAIGARTAIPTRPELEAFLSGQ